jgi:hypothetical protein
MNNILVFLGIVCGMAVIMPCVSAQSQSQNGALLTGHDRTIEDTGSKSTDIVVGSFISLGYPQPASAGMCVDSKAKFHVDKSLKGALSGELTVEYSLVSIEMPNSQFRKEMQPTVGTKYILCIINTKSIPELKNAPETYQIVKIIEGNDSNLSTVNQALLRNSSLK